ncbi:MAG: putative bifunctional diguanylate cyclase/phosphodiesterase [Gemmatimonadota bacterium]
MSWDIVGALLLVVALIVWRLYLLRQAKQLSLARERYQSLFEHNLDAVAAVDPKGSIERVNFAFSKLSGYAEGELRGTYFPSLIASEDRGRVMTVLQRAVRGRPKAFETVLQQKQGGQVELELTSVPITIDGKVVGAYEMARDITPRKEFERELESRALHDYLTGLPNRALFSDRLEHALQRVGRQGRKVALLFFDLDGFKAVNDGAGHATGDRLLRAVASRLRCFLREGDTVARLGGDEFAILLEDVGEIAVAVNAAERLGEMFEAPFRVENNDWNVGVSVGVAVSSPDVSRRPDEIIRQADLAMYEAKRRGGSCYQVYSPELDEESTASALHVEGALREAIERGDLTLHYQPVVELAGSMIVGVEALVRWQHAEHGLVPPSGFIPFAEESGVIVQLERWVLHSACRQMKRWRDEGLIRRTPFFLSVNLSPRQLQQEDVVEAIQGILKEEEFPAEHLQVEISERVAGKAAEKITELKALGLKVAIDDFGTGDSSLRYLRGLDVDLLKIDRAFVFGLGGDQTSSALVRTVLGLAEVLGLEVIVQGIEEPVQLARLQELGGRLVQGFYFGEPVDATSLETLLREGLPPAWAWRPGSGRPAPRRNRYGAGYSTM